jgi:ubiquinone/menaquinone biosynthesis C-methylase UbiE
MRTSNTVSHPIFARFYSALAKKAETAGIGEHRKRLLDSSSGKIVEVGCGSGLNFFHYPDTVEKVVGVEPEEFLKLKSIQVANQLKDKLNIEVVQGVATSLPFDDNTFDCAVTSLVLCSVDDPKKAISEMYRVVKPGGELRFYEHVRSKSPKFSQMQDRVNKFWPYFGGGCNCNRDTLGYIKDSEFEIKEADEFNFAHSKLLAPVAPMILGIAIKPDLR